MTIVFVLEKVEDVTIVVRIPLVPPVIVHQINLTATEGPVNIIFGLKIPIAVSFTNRN